MKAPWTNKAGAAKLFAIFATSLLIALGLCGLNFVAVIRFVPLVGPGDHVPPTAQEKTADLISKILGFTGFLEIATILISLIGLVFAGVKTLTQRSRDGAKEE